jgi:hypothetical protein
MSLPGDGDNLDDKCEEPMPIESDLADAVKDYEKLRDADPIFIAHKESCRILENDNAQLRETAST